MIKVFRIQDKEGRGPWKPGFSHKWVKLRPDHDNILPWYVEMGRVDLHLLPGEQGLCACETIKQLRRWFTKSEYKKLCRFGYNAVIIEVDTIIAKSDTQLFCGVRNLLNKKAEIIRLY